MMAEERKDISITPGDISMSVDLGSYYLDMRQAMVHYTEINIWGGAMDEHGVPMIKKGDELIYYPINIAQYGFMLHSEWMEKKDEKLLSQLNACIQRLDLLKTTENETCVWWHDFYLERYQLKPHWASAMAQGQLISLYLRIYQITKNEDLLQTANMAYDFLKLETSRGGVRIQEDEEEVWFEEYPSDPPSYVLNGMIYCLFGLYDLFRVSGRQDVKIDIEAGLKSLIKKLPDYTTSYWSLYDLQKKELVRYYYQKNVHIPQMEVLYKLTGYEVFKKYSNKWKKQLSASNFLFVQLMYRIRPRWLKWRRMLQSGSAL